MMSIFLRYLCRYLLLSFVFSLITVYAHSTTTTTAAATGGGGDTVTVIDIVKGKLTLLNHQYDRLFFHGNGPLWSVVNNVGSIVVPPGGSFNVIYRNLLPNGTSTIIHAHGLTPPANLDGVPYLSSLPIPAGGEQLYQYQLHPHNVGTYFLHSHYGFQHDVGLAAPLIVQGDLPSSYPNASLINSATDVIMFLEDFCPYASDAGKTQNPSCFDSRAVFNTLRENWEKNAASFNFSACMPPGNGTDVIYRHHLVNGKVLRKPEVITAAPNDLVRLRVINSAGMAQYQIQLDSALGDVTLIAVDGQLVQPVRGRKFWIAVAQRLDIVVRMPHVPGTYPVFAVLEGPVPMARSGLVFSVGNSVIKPLSSVPDEAVGFMGTQTEKLLSAWNPPKFKQLVKPIEVRLTGDNGFHGINEKSYQLVPIAPAYVPNAHPINVKRGSVVCLKFVNHNADSHPMHLHGHSFQVVEIDGESVSGAVRDTVLVPKGNCRTMTVCFEASNPSSLGWPLHCHMVQHLAGGMLTTINYIAG